MHVRHTTRPGFTIVELLVVIVVIAILAAITIVAYTGIQAKAYDSTVKSDLKNLAKQFELYRIDHGVYPAGSTQLNAIGTKVTKSAYGNGFNNGVNNILYCRVAADGPNKFALIASSKSGTVFTYTSDSGAFTTSAAWIDSNSINICNNVGINQTDSSDRDIFYLNGAWQSIAE